MYINDHVSEKKHSVTDDEAQVAIANALFAYEQRALITLLKIWLTSIILIIIIEKYIIKILNEYKLRNRIIKIIAYLQL